MTSNKLNGFKPIVTKTTQILILGSFPSVASLEHQQYYAHPRNQFWKILSDILQLPLISMPYEERLIHIKKYHIGIWDVIEQTERKGSLDSDIKNPVSNNLVTLIQSLPALTTIGFNGQTATKMGLKQLGAHQDDYHIVSLPSTSPAYTLNYTEKLIQWQALFTTLETSRMR